MAFGILRANQVLLFSQDLNKTIISYKELTMAWKDLLTTDYGLGSLAVIVFVIGMSIFFGRMFNKKMNEKPTDE